MKKVELDRRTAAALHRPIEEVREITTAFLRETTRALTEARLGESIHLEGLGTLHVFRREGVMGAARHTFVKYYVGLRRANQLTRALRAKFGVRGERPWRSTQLTKK